MNVVRTRGSCEKLLFHRACESVRIITSRKSEESLYRRIELIPFEIRASWFGFKDALMGRQRYLGYSSGLRDQTFHSDTRWQGNGSGMFQFSKLRERSHLLLSFRVLAFLTRLSWLETFFFPPLLARKRGWEQERKDEC